MLAPPTSIPETTSFVTLRNMFAGTKTAYCTFAEVIERSLLLSMKAFIASVQVIDALREAHESECFITDPVVSNGRKIQGRW